MLERRDAKRKNLTTIFIIKTGAELLNLSSAFLFLKI